MVPTEPTKRHGEGPDIEHITKTDLTGKCQRQQQEHDECPRTGNQRAKIRLKRAGRR